MTHELDQNELKEKVIKLLAERFYTFTRYRYHPTASELDLRDDWVRVVLKDIDTAFTWVIENEHNKEITE